MREIDDDRGSVAARAVSAAERARLAAVFSADGARERARGLRALLVHGLALIGLPLGAAVVWPERLPHELRSLAAAAYATGALAVLVSIVWEWRWRRVRSARIAELGPLPVPSPRAVAEAREACAGAGEEES
jgi:hypothetical protein